MVKKKKLKKNKGQKGSREKEGRKERGAKFIVKYIGDIYFICIKVNINSCVSILLKSGRYCHISP